MIRLQPNPTTHRTLDPRPTDPERNGSTAKEAHPGLTADTFERATILAFGRAPDPVGSAVREAQQAFADRFAELAEDPKAFHDMMREVYGKGYDATVAESLRVRTLAGDTSWLPRIEITSDATLQGGHGAYDAENNVVYINEKLLGDPELMAQVYTEETGHFLDSRLNTTDTVGDEGEMFRRLLGGESLTAAQRAEIRQENDKGVIYVDGKAVEVEFWKPFKKAAAAITKAAKAVGNGIRKAAQAVGGGIEKAAKAVGRGVKKAAEWIGPRIVDAGRGIGVGIWNTIRGAGLNIWEGLSTFGQGIKQIFTGEAREGFRNLGLGLLKTFVQTPLDALLMAGGRAIGAIQTLVGLEPPGRKLTAEEIAALRAVYGDSIDYDKIRVKEGRVGVFGASGRPFTHGNTIYIPREWLRENPGPENLQSLLVHESAHVWQHQNGGTDYMSEALMGQWFGEGYNIGTALFDGTPWADMNPEQQAELLEMANDNGWFADPRDPNLRFLVRLTDPGSDHGFDVEVIDLNSPDYQTLVDQGYGDFTDPLNASIEAMRRGDGAP